MTVYLVGAGPGDPGLLTVRARELIARADVILLRPADPAGALDEARGASSSTWARRAAAPQMPQEEIDRLLVEYGRGGRTVVRLKGGDPFVFGRGGEEALVLRAAGIPFEVVPGITAGIAAPAYAGIPVTHRELPARVAFVTGHEDPASRVALDWPALAAFPGTLVFYMGVQGAAADRRAAGRRRARRRTSPSRWSSAARCRASGRVVATLARRRPSAAAGIRAPAITLVGPVAGAARADRVARGAAAARAHGRGDARAGAG